MKTVLTFLLLASLLCMLIQDWKYRRIHIFFPVVILVVSVFLVSISFKLIANVVLYNLSFFLITLGILVLYMSLRNKQFLNPFENYFGLGDVLFYVAITPLLVLKNYVLFFIFSLAFAVFLYLILKKMMKESTVPLAGFASLLLFFIIISDAFLNFPKMTLL